MVKKFIIFLFLLNLIGCSNNSGGEKNNVPPTVELGNSIDIVIDPVKLEQPDFGVITSTEPVNTFLNIRNTGTKEITNLNISLTGIDASFFNLINGSCPSLQPLEGNKCSIQVQFSGAGKLNRIYFAQLDINGIKFPFSAELAIQSSGVSDYQIYQDSQFVPSAIDLGKTENSILKQTVVLKHLLRKASGNLPIIMTDSNFSVNRTSCPAVEINRNGCEITISFDPNGKAYKSYNASFKIGSVNPMPVDLQIKAEKAAAQGMPDFHFYIDNQSVNSYSFGTITVPEKKFVEIIIKNEGLTPGVPNLNIMPNQIYMIGDNNCNVSIPQNGTCSVKIYATSFNRLANNYQSKLYASNASMNLQTFVYVPNQCNVGTHLDPEMLTCIGDRQTEIIANGTRSRIWFAAPLPGNWDAWMYNCLEPKFELNDTADACIPKRRALNLEYEGSGVVSGGNSGMYDFDTVVTLKATPATNYKFKEWMGDGSCVGSVVTCTITMNQARNVRAVFYIPPLEITPNPIQLLVNGSIQLSTTGGIPPYTYELVQNAQGTINTATGLYKAPSTPTQGAVRVKDSDNRVVDVSLQVAYPLLAPAGVFNVVTDAKSTLGVTQGFPPYSFTTISGVGTPGENDGFYHTGSSPGTAYVTVTDGIGESVNVNINVVYGLEVAPYPLIAEVNTNTDLLITKGILPYSIELIKVDSNTPKVGEMSSKTFKSGSVAGVSIIKVTDGMNTVVNVPVSVIEKFELPEATISLLFNSSKQILVNGGLSPYTYTKISGPGVLDATGFFTAFSESGKAIIKISDSLGNYKNQEINIYPPMITGLDNFKMLVNQQKQIIPTGGAGGPYKISLVSGLGTITTDKIYSSSIITTATIHIEDSIGFQKVNQTIEVLPEFKNPAYNYNLLVGNILQLLPSGGLTPYTYVVKNGGKGTVSSSGLYTAPTNQATPDVVQITDSLGNKIEININVVLPLTVISPTPEIYTNQTANIVPSNGLPPYSYRVSKGIGTVDSSGIFSAAGTATIATIEVIDAMGSKVTQNITVYGTFVVSPLTKNMLINNPQQISASGGKTPYVYTIISGPGSINSSGLFTAGSSAGDTVITVADSLSSSTNLNYKTVMPLIVTPNSANVLVSQTLQFTVTGGLSPYTYQVTSGLGSINSTGLYTAPTVANDEKVRITDSMGNISNINIKVIAELSVPANMITVINKTQTISPTGGLSPYIFSIQSGSGTINNSGVYSTSGSIGTDVIKIQDSYGQVKTITVDVRDGITISPSSQYLTVNETQQYSATGGVPPYSYSVLNGRGSINSSSGLYSAGTLSGNAVIQVTDSLGNTAEANMQVLGTLKLTATNTSMVTNQSQQLNVSGGLNPYTYSVVSGGGTVSASGMFTAPNNTGIVVIQVNDGATPVHTAQLSLSIAPPLSLSPSDGIMTVNSIKQFTATGGVPPYIFAASAGNISGTGSYTSPLTAGNQVIQVSDSIGGVTTVTVSVIAEFKLLILANINLLSGQNYDVLVSGGLPPYNYQITSGSGTINSGGRYTAPNTPTVDTVTVTDQLGNTKTVKFTVVNPLVVSLDKISVMVSKTKSLTVSDGLPPYTYSYSGVGTFNSATKIYTAPASVGSGTLTITDAIGQQKILPVTVYTALTISGPSGTYVGMNNATFSATGGYVGTGYTYSIVGNGSIDSITGKYTAPATISGGSETVTVTVSDNETPVNTSSTTLTVYSGFTVTDIAMSPAGTKFLFTGTNLQAVTIVKMLDMSNNVLDTLTVQSATSTQVIAIPNINSTIKEGDSFQFEIK